MAHHICLRPPNNLSHLPSIQLMSGESKTIGRSTAADIVIDEPALSRVHARITVMQDGTAAVEDLRSMNGVFVNGVKRDQAKLAIGDLVAFASSVQYRIEDAPKPQVEPAAAPALNEQTIVRMPVADALAKPVDRAALEALLATSRDLMAFTDLNVLLNDVLDRFQSILDTDRSAILLFDQTTAELKPRLVRPDGAYASVSQFASSTIVREAIRLRETIVVFDASLDERLRDAASVAGAQVTGIVCVPLLGRAGPIGALYADQRSRPGLLTPDKTRYAAAFAAHVATALETAQLYADRERYFHGTLEAFARAIDARDAYTAGHSERVTAYSLELGRIAGLADEELEVLRRSGMLHDLGKVGVPDRILLKPAALDAEERELMEAHVVIGFNMLAPLPFLAKSLPTIRGHHERWDGKGYPDKLAGTGIGFHARLMAVADSYDAMTSERPYRQALPPEEAARRIRADRGTQFDPDAVEAFDAAEAEFNTIRRAMVASSRRTRVMGSAG